MRSVVRKLDGALLQYTSFCFIFFFCGSIRFEFFVLNFIHTKMNENIYELSIAYTSLLVERKFRNPNDRYDEIYTYHLHLEYQLVC